MSFFKRSIIMDAMRPNNESADVTTEEVGQSQDAVVEIARVKQDHQDTMAIHALEQDIALIERQGESVEELETATQEITELQQTMESFYEKGGMTAVDAMHIQRQVNWIGRRTGLSLKLPSQESFRGSAADRIALTASCEGMIGDALSKLWEGIKKIFKKIKDTILGWFGKAEKSIDDEKEEVKKTADELNKAADKNETKEVKEGDSKAAKVAEKSLDPKDKGATIKPSNLFGKVDKAFENTANYCADVSRQLQSIKFMKLNINELMTKPVNVLQQLGYQVNMDMEEIRKGLVTDALEGNAPLLVGSQGKLANNTDKETIFESPVLCGGMKITAIVEKNDEFYPTVSFKYVGSGAKPESNSIKIGSDGVTKSNFIVILNKIHSKLELIEKEGAEFKKNAEKVLEAVEKSGNLGMTGADEETKNAHEAFKTITGYMKWAGSLISKHPIYEVTKDALVLSQYYRQWARSL